MRILFLGYWGLHDGLTVSTIFPHLRILQERPDVAAVRLVTIERGAEAQAELTFAPGFETGKISFEPLRSRPGRNVILNKIEDFTRFPNELVKQVAEFRPDFILARGTPAGSLAYLVWQKTKLPFYVESYEPHADYMLDSGVWGRYDPRYLFQRHWEIKQKELALGLMPVAENYRQQLIREGVPAGRVVTVPCSVNADAFAFDAGARARVRQRLGWPAEAVVGVYVGKFGGIYYDEEAFEVFKMAAEYFGPAFRLLLLTPLPAGVVQNRLASVGLSPAQTFVAKVPFVEVPQFLSAADFAFGLHRPTLFVSPIKHGEYWANGLPIFLSDGVGDDSEIIKKEGGGAVFEWANPYSIRIGLQDIKTLLLTPHYRAKSQMLAQKYRSTRPVEAAYSLIMTDNSKDRD